MVLLGDVERIGLLGLCDELGVHAMSKDADEDDQIGWSAGRHLHPAGAGCSTRGSAGNRRTGTDLCDAAG